MVRFKFKALRKLKHISQTSLAIRVGISQSWLNEIENNTYKRSPSFKVIENIAEELNVKLFDILEVI